MNSANYSQFLRLYSSKYANNSLAAIPHVQNEAITRKVQYIADSSISEKDVSTLIHFVILSQSINIGFSAKFLSIHTSFGQLSKGNLSGTSILPKYVPEKIGVWCVGARSSSLRIEKKYSVKSTLIHSVRKLFRRSGVDFYVDQASFTVNYRFSGNLKRSSWLKENEILIRFFGFPLRITS